MYVVDLKKKKDKKKQQIKKTKNCILPWELAPAAIVYFVILVTGYSSGSYLKPL